MAEIPVARLSIEIYDKMVMLLKVNIYELLSPIYPVLYQKDVTIYVDGKPVPYVIL